MPMESGIYCVVWKNLNNNIDNRDNNPQIVFLCSVFVSDRTGGGGVLKIELHQEGLEDQTLRGNSLYLTPLVFMKSLMAVSLN